MSAPREELATIDPALLSQISAGSQIDSDLNGLLDTLHSLASFGKQSGFSTQDTLMLLLVLQAQRRPVVPWAPPIVYY